MLDFRGLVVVVTGAGAGLGRRYAVDLGRAGASVVVHARRPEAATAVAAEVEQAGGRAATVVADARDGAAIVDGARQAFGDLDAVIVNAGAVRDRTFARMTPAEWSEVIDVHLGGAFAVTSAAWPHLIARGAGRLVLTTSGAGFHGNVGQANYAAAKAGIIGLTRTLALEGQRNGVLVNTIAPMAHTGMTDRVFDKPLREGLPAAAVSPFVLAMAHPRFTRTGCVVEAGGGWAAELRWERSAGVRFPAEDLDPAMVLERWPEIAGFDDRADHPSSTADALSAALTAGGSPGTRR